MEGENVDIKKKGLIEFLFDIRDKNTRLITLIPRTQARIWQQLKQR